MIQVGGKPAESLGDYKNESYFKYEQKIWFILKQGSLNLGLEDQCTAEFSSNSPI